MHPQAKAEKLGWHSHKRRGALLGNQVTHSLVGSGRKAFWMSFMYYWKEQIEFGKKKKDCSELEKRVILAEQPNISLWVFIFFYPSSNVAINDRYQQLMIYLVMPIEAQFLFDRWIDRCRDGVSAPLYLTSVHCNLCAYRQCKLASNHAMAPGYTHIIPQQN